MGKRLRVERGEFGLLLAFLIPALGFSGCGAGDQAAPTADLVLLGGAVYTMGPSVSQASAIAVSDGRIAFVGDDREARTWIGPSTEVVELSGQMVLPGFQDAHVHPLYGGVEQGDCDLNQTLSADEVLAEIAECARRRADAKWVRGGGYQLTYFPDGNPTAAMLDEIESERPVYLSSADGHSAWVNSAALELAGVTAATPDPEAGRIERDPNSGEPTGTLREAAMQLVSELLPPHTPEELETGLRRALEMAARFGITALQDADAGETTVATYAELARRGELTARVSLSLQTNPERGVEQVAELLALRDRFDSEALRVNTVKLFADGVLEAQTGAVLEPYVGLDGYKGEPNFSPGALSELVAALDAEGFQIHIHAIGDGAIRMSLDAFENARGVNGPRDARHHLAHIQLFDPEDIPRFRELGVIANFQPLWAYADEYITDLTVPFLGPERSRWLYPIRSLIDSGATVVFGSDWSVSSMNPLLGIEVGVTRQSPEDPPTPVWIPEEQVDLTTMIAGYTIEAAKVNFLEEETGSIEVGKVADLVVLERDLFSVPPREIGEVKVLLTLLGGEVIYQAAEN